MFRAVYRGHKEIVEMLLEAGANAWHIDSDNMTAFEIAARYNSSHCLPVLRHYMGAEADAISLEGLLENEEMPHLFRTHAGTLLP